MNDLVFCERNINCVNTYIYILSQSQDLMIYVFIGLNRFFFIFYFRIVYLLASYESLVQSHSNYICLGTKQPDSDLSPENLWELVRVYENYLRDFGEELREICEEIQERETRIFEEHFSLDWFSVYNSYINRSSKENKTMRMNKQMEMNKLMKTRFGKVTFG